MASFCFKNYYTSTNTYAQHAGADNNMGYTVVPPKFLKKHLVYILFNNMYMYNILLYTITSLLSPYNNLTILHSQLFYHRLVI